MKWSEAGAFDWDHIGTMTWDTIKYLQYVYPDSILPNGSFGASTVYNFDQYIYPDSILSNLHFGSAFVAFLIEATSVDPLTSFGPTRVDTQILDASIDPDGGFGLPKIGHDRVTGATIEPGGGFGVPYIVSAIIYPASIYPSSYLYLYRWNQVGAVTWADVDDYNWTNFGNQANGLTITPGDVTIYPDSVNDGAHFGSANISQPSVVVKVLLSYLMRKVIETYGAEQLDLSHEGRQVGMSYLGRKTELDYIIKY